MTKQCKVSMIMPEPPKGWEYTGEFRIPEKGESYYSIHATDKYRRFVGTGRGKNKQFILRKFVL